MIGTDKEKTLYQSQSEDYKKLAKISLENRISIDLFVFNNDYYDLATIGSLVTTTGGSLYYYHGYDPQ